MELKKPWKFEEDVEEIINMVDADKTIIWRGELKDDKQWNGFGIFEIETEERIWVYEGVLKEGNYDGEGNLTTYFKRLNEKKEIEKTVAKTKLFYDKDSSISKGKLFENGREFFVQFKNGIEVEGSKKRTFEGKNFKIKMKKLR